MSKNIHLEIPTPLEFLKPRLQKIPFHIRVSFITAVCSTFFIHLFYFTGRFANEDDRHYIRGYIWNINIGRWADKYRLIGDYFLPIALFFIFILSLALTVCITIHLLHIQRVDSCVLLAIALPTFPCLAVGNGFLFMVGTYSVAILCAALAVFMTRQYRFGWLPGALLLAISLGQYQSYVALAMTLCLMSILIEFLLQKLENKELLKLIFRYLTMGILGVLCYFVILHVLLKISGQELLSYKGINDMGHIPLSQLPALLIRTYKTFVNFFLGRVFIAAKGWLLAAYLCLGLLCVGLLAAVVIRRKMYRQPVAFLFLIVLLLAFPICANVIDLIAPESRTTTLNIFAFSMVLPLVCALAELAEGFAPDASGARTRQALTSWGLLAVMVVIGWNWFLQTNIYYNKINSYYEHTMLLCNRIFSRIESLPEFSQGAEVAFILDDNGVNYSFSEATDYGDVFLEDRGLWDPMIGFSREKDSRRAVERMINILGIRIVPVSLSRIEEIKKTDAYQELNVWPAEGCVGVVDGVIVVNFVHSKAVAELQGDAIIFDMVSKLRAYDLAGASYIWYIYRDGERVNARNNASSTYAYTPETAGDYYAQLFVKRRNGDTLFYETPIITIPE